MIINKEVVLNGFQYFCCKKSNHTFSIPEVQLRSRGYFTSHILKNIVLEETLGAGFLFSRKAVIEYKDDRDYGEYLEVLLVDSNNPTVGYIIKFLYLGEDMQNVLVSRIVEVCEHFRKIFKLQDLYTCNFRYIINLPKQEE